jgi:hypothetical protein
MAITATERTQIVELAVLMFNAAPGATYLSQLVSMYEANGHNLQALAVTLAGTPAYQSLNPNFQVAADFAAAFLTPLGLQADSVAVAFVTSKFNAGESKGQIAFEAFTALNGITSANGAQYQAAKAILLNKTAVAEYYSETLNVAQTNLTVLQTVLSGVTADVASVTAAETALLSASGQTFALTTGIDVLAGTAGNDTFNAVLGAGAFDPVATLNSGDSVDGAGGTNNVLNIIDGTSGAFSAPAQDVLPIDVTIKNIQTINLSTTGNAGSATGSFDTSAIAGLTALNVISNGTLGDFIKASTSTNVSQIGATAVTISGGANDTVSTKGTGSTVSVSGASGNVTVTATDSVSVTGAKGAVSITTKVPATALAGVTGVVVKGGTTVSVTETAGTSTAGAAPTGNATVVNIGVAPSAVAGATTSGFPQVISGLSSDPTGNVTVSVKTAYTDTSGRAAVGFGTGAVNVYMNGGTAATITGGSAVVVKDVQTTALMSSATATAAAGTSALASVSLDGISGGATLTSDALSYVSVLDSAGQTVTVVNTTAGHALALTVGNDGSSGTPLTIADAIAKSVAVNSQASAFEAVGGAAINKGSASWLTLNTPKATSLTFSQSQKINLVESGAMVAKVATITDTGSGALNLGDVSGATYAALTLVDASAATGAVTATINGAEVFKGGAGNDTVTLNGALTTTSGGSISLGGGDDSLIAGVSASIGTGVSVDGGAGTNTISASLVNVGSAPGIVNFQVLDISGYGSGAGFGALDAALLGTPVSGIVISSAETSGTATLLNLAANVTVTDNANGVLGSSLVLTHAGTGPNSLAVNFAPPAADRGYISSITSKADTSVTIASDGGTPGTTYNWLGALHETDNVLSNITVTGGTYLYLQGVQTNFGATTATADVASSLQVIDASATTGGVWISQGANVAIGASGFNTTDTGLTIKGGTGGDTIRNFADNGSIIAGATAKTTVNYDGDNGGIGNYLEVDGKNAVINDSASAAGDALVLNGAKDSAIVGSGANVHVWLNGTNDTVTLGSGNTATVTVADSLALGDVAHVNFGSGTATVVDNLLYHVTASTVSAATNGDMLALNAALTGDTVTFGAALGNAAGALGAATSVAAAQTIDQAIYYADQASAVANTAVWFQAGGNTYIVDNGANANGGTADDTVIVITGAHDLSLATVAVASITFA